MSYVVFKHAGRPVMALPLDSRFAVLRAAISSFPAFTFKRKIFKIAALAWAFALWRARRLGLPAGAALDSLDVAVLARIKAICPRMVAAMPIWSLVPGRQRMYFRVFDAHAKECAFVKLSRAEPGRSRLKVEAAALQRYADAQSFTCPRVLTLDVTEDDVLLLTSVLPPGSNLRHAETSAFPSEIHAEIQNETVQAPFATLRSRAWYQRGMATLTENLLVTSELAAMDDEALVTLAPAHGDFGSENFFVDPSDRVFLIDWEHHNPEAPIATDAVGFWIGRHHRAIQRGQPSIAQDFAAAFKGHSNTDLLLALVYLSAFEVRDAERLVALWKN